MCGGTRLLLVVAVADDGLSPRVRGNPLPQRRAPEYLRSIPACAGEPRRSKHHALHLWVYPRVCGGTRRRPRRPPVCRGLSPRVRGNHSAASDRMGGIRSIPACAGEPSPSSGGIA